MTLPFVLSMPHCSLRVPQELESDYAVSPQDMRQGSDIATEEIYGAVPAHFLHPARWSRFVVDLNRAPERRDPKGVIPTEDFYQRPVFKPGRAPDETEIQRRLAKYYWPWHQELRRALQQRGVAAFFDCHSMDAKGPPGAPDSAEDRADICLGNNGDRSGRRFREDDVTCPAGMLAQAAQAFEAQGFSVALNWPYAGAYIVRTYGPLLRSQGGVTLQVEINKRCYCQAGGLETDPAMLANARRRVAAAFGALAQFI